MIEAHKTPEGYREFYTSLAQMWPEEDLVYSHPMAKLRYRFLLRILRPYAYNGYRMLDAGCGSGIYTIAFAQQGGKAIGVDIAPENIRRASQRAHECGFDEASCSFVIGDIGEIALPAPVELVFCSETLEHVLDPRATLLNLDRNLSPGGTIILSTPNKYLVTAANLLMNKRLLPPQCLGVGTYAAMHFQYNGSLGSFLLSLVKGGPVRVETDWVVDTSRVAKGSEMPKAQYIHRAYTPDELFRMLPVVSYQPVVKKTCVYYLPIVASLLPTTLYLKSIDIISQFVPVWKNLGVHSLVVARKHVST